MCGWVALSSEEDLVQSVGGYSVQQQQQQKEEGRIRARDNGNLSVIRSHSFLGSCSLPPTPVTPTGGR